MPGFDIAYATFKTDYVLNHYYTHKYEEGYVFSILNIYVLVIISASNVYLLVSISVINI